MAARDIEMSRVDEDREAFLPAPAQQRRTTEPQYPPALVAVVVAFYFIISLAVVFLNKFILSSSEYKFPYPLFVTWFQLLVALGLLVAWAKLGQYKKAFSIIPPYEFDLSIAKRVAPLTVVYVLMLAFNNLCLQYVEVTFYQVARSLSIHFSILFTYLILGKKTSTAAIGACGIVFLGFVVGSYGEINFSWEGLIYGVGSSAFVALYGIYVQKSLAIVDNNQWRLLHYNTTLAILILLPVVMLSGEVSEILDNVQFLGDIGFWVLMTFTAATGFGINIAMFLQVKYTSALTNTISGTAKACVQTLLAAMIFRNPISFMNGVGIFLALFGSGYYGYVRYMERMTK
ncbi:hypothetical protein K450DRAFT_228911 [Umbelopsis ramanniana AG]|uniref:Sugar phosphate transporter domain-containing protein n=1 Tax=Umbelopsis ramanniana AG TaxID=1314678 RepID=A0AAD5EDV6_UMBRA|nr:uncharacterized protein K450DRAFT_228911 [Umbelopsis ramanniana AG]KAI8582081.1 hypothetical protein K450DRAFT_228911 [Umbelopsis ramanniana AG]